jgi:large subunit ribosomal protein L15
MTTGIHSFKPNPGATHKRKRIGRGPGGGHGKTAGRGEKGMWSRSGSHTKRGFEGGQMPLHRRLPKRGFTNDPFKKEFTVINVSDLDRFEKGSKIGPQELIAAGLVRKVAKFGLRILGDGQIDRALHVSAHYFTESARQKITNAGGTCEVIKL